VRARKEPKNIARAASTQDPNAVVISTVRRLTPDAFIDDSGMAKGLQTAVSWTP
jgi:hypothetical protein